MIAEQNALISVCISCTYIVLIVLIIFNCAKEKNSIELEVRRDRFFHPDVINVFRGIILRTFFVLFCGCIVDILISLCFPGRVLIL